MKYQFMRFPGGRGKAVTLSYDDGCPEDIRFSQVISDAGLKCTFNLNGRIARKNFLEDDEVRTNFLDRGHEIAVHGLNHRAEGVIRTLEGIRDVLDCRLDLEERFGMIVRGMAYPDVGIRKMANGASYERIKNYLEELGIVYARTLGGDNNSFELPEDWYAWMPTAHHENPRVLEMIDEFLAVDTSPAANRSRRTPRLFYLWGHSFEFERGNKWALLDEICRKLGGREEIWYATNIEIYEYVKAYQSLVYSANGYIVYNPTLYEIWFEVDGVPYSIKPGETLNIAQP